MNIANWQDLSVKRADAFQILLAIGADLTGVSLSFTVKVSRDTADSALMTLSSGSGITVIDSGADLDGTPYSTIELFKAKAAFVSAFAGKPAPLPGQPAVFAYDLKWTPSSALVAPATAVEETIMSGNLYILGSV